MREFRGVCERESERARESVCIWMRERDGKYMCGKETLQRTVTHCDTLQHTAIHSIWQTDVCVVERQHVCVAERHVGKETEWASVCLCVRERERTGKRAIVLSIDNFFLLSDLLGQSKLKKVDCDVRLWAQAPIYIVDRKARERASVGREKKCDWQLDCYRVAKTHRIP